MSVLGTVPRALTKAAEADAGNTAPRTSQAAVRLFGVEQPKHRVSGDCLVGALGERFE